MIPRREPGARLGRAPWYLAPLVLVAAVIAIQLGAGAYGREFVNNSDEAPHFVSGVMVYDYLTSGLGSSPLGFAEEYYLRYPKVAIGHWPPVFYAVQGVWYGLVGPSKAGATILVGLVLAALGWCVFVRLASMHGAAIAAIATAVLLAQPLVATQGILIMSDAATCLATLLAVFAFSDFLRTGRSSHATLFALWSIVAILTKPTALALAPFVPICILFARRPGTFADWRLWIAGALVGLATAPFYLWTWSKGMGLHTHGSIGEMLGQALDVERSMRGSDAVVTVAPVWLFAVAALGCSAVPLLRRRATSPPEPQEVDAAAALALCVATAFFLHAAPIASGPRYFLPLIAASIVLFAAGLQWIRTHVPGPDAVAWTAVGFVAGSVALAAPGRLPAAVQGYSAAAASLGEPIPGRVTLVSSDSSGEGAFVLERLLMDRDRCEFVLRASKVLSTSDWSGGNYRPRFTSPQELEAFVDSLPVHVIVLDDYGVRAGASPHHELLSRTVSDAPERFRLVAKIPVVAGGERLDREIRVYENRVARARPLDAVMSQLRALMGPGLGTGTRSAPRGE